MSEPFLLPEYAIVGHPNEGKSSVVSTLTEDDQVRISSLPGETLVSRDYPDRINGKDILRFIDTPGFQHPQQLLEWMRQNEGGQVHPARAFLDAHPTEPALAQDRELLAPLARGSGIIYVVDGSRPVRQHDLAEMEILRLSGNPRMAVINPKIEDPRYLEDWKKACAQSFNSTRIFNALQATYRERLALLESLKGIQQDWEPALAEAIQAFQADWDHRNEQVAGVMCDLLSTALKHVESRNVFVQADEAPTRAELVETYQKAITRMEERAQAEIRRLYKHNIFRLDLPEQSILREDLFTEKTWQLLGLTRKQILIAAGVLGAGAGLPIDFLLGHLTFGLFTLSGAAVATVAAWFKGENMARVRVQKLKLGGIQVVVGPNQNPQFPFVLMDRILLYYQNTINWAHARREAAPDKATAGERTGDAKAGFTSRWTNPQRQTCLDFIKSLNQRNLQKRDEAERAFQAMFQGALEELTQRHEDGKGLRG